MQNFKRIALAYTNEATKDISEELLLHEAGENKKTVELVACDCSDSWPFFEQGIV